MWLDEIEEDIEIELEVQMADAKRMARVLRELAGIVSKVKRYMPIRYYDDLEALSDDAKELLG